MNNKKLREAAAGEKRVRLFPVPVNLVYLPGRAEPEVSLYEKHLTLVLDGRGIAVRTDVTVRGSAPCRADRSVVGVADQVAAG